MACPCAWAEGPSRSAWVNWHAGAGPAWRSERLRGPGYRSGRQVARRYPRVQICAGGGAECHSLTPDCGNCSEGELHPGPEESSEELLQTRETNKITKINNQQTKVQKYFKVLLTIKARLEILMWILFICCWFSTFHKFAAELQCDHFFSFYYCN